MESIRCSKISNKNMVKNNTYPTHLSFDSAALHQSPNTMTAINKTWLPIRSTITTPPKQNSSMPPCKKSWNKLRFFPCFFHVFASFNFGRGSLGFRFKSFLKNTHTQNRPTPLLLWHWFPVATSVVPRWSSMLRSKAWIACLRGAGFFAAGETCHRKRRGQRTFGQRGLWVSTWCVKREAFFFWQMKHDGLRLM